jgi:formylglycine-generating enzyme required for sulfatase activity
MHSDAVKTITLMTDFGLRDGFVGVMKGVILSKVPEATPEPEKKPARKKALRSKGIRRLSFEPELVRVEAGYFWMGSDERDEEAYNDEKPKHRVYLAEFYIGRYPVTVAQFAAFVQDSGFRTEAERGNSEWTWRQPSGRGTRVRDKSEYPVTQVSWNDALEYCRWLSDVTGRRYTPPSEAEWEKAARGADRRTYPWGNAWEAKRCNTSEGGKNDTTPVGYYSPEGDSPYGCADMAGDVWEWTRSLWGDYPYPETERGRMERESLSATSSRVVRGGGWSLNRLDARCAFRLRLAPGYFGGSRGLRVVSPG